MTLLAAADLELAYSGLAVCRGISLSVDEGEIVALIGANGAGKSTTLRAIAGQLIPRTGTITFRGRDITRLPAHERATRGIALVPEGRRVFPFLTARENLELALARTSKGVLATLRARLSEEQRDRIESTLETIGLGAHADERAGGLSHGEKQWLEIGMVIVQDAELLLVDEPVAGMTDEETEKTGRLLQGIAQERAVLVIEHDMEFVRSIARTVTVLHEGSVLCEGPVDQIQSDERVMEVYLGRSRDSDG